MTTPSPRARAFARTPESRSRLVIRPALDDPDLIEIDGVMHRIVERFHTGTHLDCRAVPVDKLSTYSPKRPWVPVENPRFRAWEEQEKRRAKEIERRERVKQQHQGNLAADAASTGDA